MIEVGHVIAEALMPDFHFSNEFIASKNLTVCDALNDLKLLIRPMRSHMGLKP